MINVILHGYLGKMGRTLEKLIAERDDMQVVCGMDIGLTGQESPEGDNGIALCSKPEQFTGEADVIIDFSNHAAVKELLYYAKERQIPVIVATTGLTEDELAYVNETAEKVAVFRSANMSLGINLMAKALQLMTPFVEKDFDMEIVEMHHNMKKDAPSGTALLLADKINEVCEEKKKYIYGREGGNLAFDRKQMGIHALRGGTVAGEHKVIFAGPDEIIEVRHLALSREIFAHGALTAAAFMAGKEPGLYSMDDIIG